MAIISPAKMRILKELAKEPLHGYALSKRLGVTISSIYEHLSELEREGLIIFEVEGRRKVYRLTNKGEELLKLLDK